MTQPRNRWTTPEPVIQDQKIKPEKKIESIKSIDTTSFVKCLDYLNLKRTGYGITFEIRLFDKEGVLKIHPISCNKKEARKFAKQILRLTKPKEETK